MLALQECKAVVASIGYDELVKVLIDCEVVDGP